MQGWTEAPDLAKWVRRQRVARAQGALSEERLQVLYAMGFEFGEVAQLTEEWESKFDQLIEWLLWQVCSQPLEWGACLLDTMLVVRFESSEDRPFQIVPTRHRPLQLCRCPTYTIASKIMLAHQQTWLLGVRPATQRGVQMLSVS